MSNFAWVTLTTNDTYSLGALVLAHSLRRAGTVHQLAVLVTPGVSESMRGKLKDVYDLVEEVNVMDSQDAANLALLSRPELGITFTKLHCWRLVQYQKCVFLDSDTLVLKNSDELFEREELSAAPDVSWPDCFNSGVFVYRPSVETYEKLVEFALKNGSFDGGDQGLLNSYFADWAHKDITKHLPFIYNVTAYASYCYLPAFKQFRNQIKILHFAGKMKPWLVQFNSASRTASTPTDYAHAADLIQLWWNIFCDNVHQKLTDSMNYYLATLPQTLQWCLGPKRQHNVELYAHYHHFEHHQHEYHHQHNHHQENYYGQQQQQQKHIYEDFANIVFHDPWEDYYQNLERQVQEAEENEQQQQEQNSMNSEEVTIVEQHTVEQVGEEVIEVEEDEEEDEEEKEEEEKDSVTEEFPAACQAAADDWVLLDPTRLHEPIECDQVNEESGDEAPNDGDEEAGLAGALSQLRLGEPRTAEQEAYEQLMRRQCWESGQIDYAGKDSFDNILKRITQTLDEKPAPKADDKSELLTSADIQDGKTEYDKVTNSTTTYKLIDGGYEMHIQTPQPNGTMKTQVKTFWDPKPVDEAEMRKQAADKKVIRSRFGKEIRIDKNTTMLTREIDGGYEEVYTTINDDGTRSMRTKTFWDAVPTELDDNSNTTKTTTTSNTSDKKKKTVTRKSSVDSTDSTESRKIVQKKNVSDQQSKYQEHSTIEETRRVTQNIEITENNRTVRKNSLQEQNIKAIMSTSGNTNDASKKKKKTKSNIPPPPPDFIENDTTTVSSKRVPHGVEYTYSTQLESGKTITTTKTVYEEEECEMTEEEIREYKKTLKDAEKHKNVTSTKKLKSESGTKKVVPSENPGDVTTVETIKIQGGTEYHYTTVTAEGIVKKAVKTIYDPVPSKGGDDDESEEEIVEEYEEEIIEPGEKNVRTIETIKTLPRKFEEEVTITHEKKEKKVKKSMMISQ